MRSDNIEQFLQERIDAGDFPSAVYLAAEKDKIVLHGALGHAVVEPESIRAQTYTIYDMASVTKPLITGMLTAMLIENGELSLDDRVSDLLPDFCAEDKNEITVCEMLTHTSRLAAWKPLYLCVDDPENVVEEIARTPLTEAVDAVTYSDLNFITLGRLIERVTGHCLDDVAADTIFGPLGLRRTFYVPHTFFKSTVAASEKGNGFEKQTCLEQGYLKEGEGGDEFFRTGTIWGEVHDGNAYFMGGVAGHAGLFSTAEDTFRMAQQFLPAYSKMLGPEMCKLFQTNFTAGRNEHRSLGFQLASTPESTASAALPPQSFGHLGFTGTSLWIDPLNERVYVLLTNRTHHHELPFVNTNSIRRRFHELAAAHVDAKT